MKAAEVKAGASEHNS
jgi:hypothetical protein